MPAAEQASRHGATHAAAGAQDEESLTLVYIWTETLTHADGSVEQLPSTISVTRLASRRTIVSQTYDALLTEANQLVAQ